MTDHTAHCLALKISGKSEADMVDNLISSKRDGQLREKTEALLQISAEDPLPPAANMLELIHELRIYQAELKIQNEALRRSQQELTTLNHEYEELYQFAPCGYITLNPKGIVTRINLTGISLLGTLGTTIIGANLSRYIADEHQDAFYRARGKSAQTGAIQSLDMRLKSDSNDALWVRTDVDVTRNDAGEVLQWRVLMVDISERLRTAAQSEALEAKFQHARKMHSLGTLAGGISHEFNNCLAIILGNLELAKGTIDAASPGKEYIHEAIATGNRAMKVVRQLLTFTRMNFEKKKPVNLTPVVVDTLKIIRATIAADINIITDLQEDLFYVKADTTQIHQIIINFSRNAADAMSADGGLLKIVLQNTLLFSADPRCGHKLRPGRYVELIVSDTGHGMDEGTLSQIFDPYFTTKELGKGSGLGLAVVHGIVENHGGSIFVDSLPGKGSAFSILFPETLEHIKAEKPAEGDLITGGERILFVDDQTAITKVAKAQLAHLGYEVTAFNHPLEALTHFESAPQRYDLVITDMTMPHLTGEQLGSKLRRIRRDIPIILCTGYNDRVITSDIAELGVNDVLIKPYRNEILSKTIRRVLSDRNQQCPDGHE
jgi:signal transduction histidine kinase/ActR/RegA family two-component response regulator